MSEVILHTSRGKIRIKLLIKDAPTTCQNFLDYASSEFYDGTIFHRVIPGFVIQGGGFSPGMEQKPARASIKNEANNGVKNKAGTLAMARTPDPNSATSQFFINLADNDFLNFTAATPSGWGYCVFAEVLEGMEVAQDISRTKTTAHDGHQDVPSEDILLNQVEILQAATDS